MSAVPITVFFSVLLAGLFVTLFVLDQRRREFASAEHDSLLPLADERPAPPGGMPTQAGEDHDHEHGHACGCRDGSRPPCAGCLRRRTDVPRAHSPRP
ncbi:MAG TPA: hypothetical protein VHD32_15145 [Candidatus Didemnitutus sp.]|nr:hypothetical protein [Candidatus Didemnitutus sp.]